MGWEARAFQQNGVYNKICFVWRVPDKYYIIRDRHLATSVVCCSASSQAASFGHLRSKHKVQGDVFIRRVH